MKMPSDAPQQRINTKHWRIPVFPLSASTPLRKKVLPSNQFTFTSRALTFTREWLPKYTVTKALQYSAEIIFRTRRKLLYPIKSRDLCLANLLKTKRITVMKKSKCSCRNNQTSYQPLHPGATTERMQSNETMKNARPLKNIQQIKNLYNTYTSNWLPSIQRQKELTA